MLKGLVFDDAGNAMQPIHTRRGDKRYHYYVSSPKVHGDDREVGSLPRVSAHTLDAFVTDNVLALIRANRPQTGIKNDPVRAAVTKVTVGAEVIRITLLREACRADLIGRQVKRLKEAGRLP